MLTVIFIGWKEGGFVSASCFQDNRQPDPQSWHSRTGQEDSRQHGVRMAFSIRCQLLQLDLIRKCLPPTSFDFHDLNCDNLQIQPALPALRKSRGTIILTSSGAAASAYSTWGAYGSSKAAMNHLALTLAVEEPTITTLSIRPGVVDTDMQALIRTKESIMDAKDMEKFKGLFAGGKLVKAEDVGGVMARISVGLGGEEGKGSELNGKFLR